MDRRSEEKLLMEEESTYVQLGRDGSSTRHWMLATLRRVCKLPLNCWPHLGDVMSCFVQVVAEMLGTFFLMMSVCGSIMAGWDITGQALAVAFSLIMVISSLGHVSGAHLNPAISVAFAATKQLPWSQVPLYFGGQLAGATAAMALAKLLYQAGDGVALTQPSGGWGQAFAMEVVLTFGLSFIATAMNTQPNFDGIHGAVVIASTVAMNMLLGGEISGASMNPVRSLAPAMVQNDYNGIWIYLLAPTIGALMGSFLYKLIQIDVVY